MAELLEAFITLFVIMDPICNIPLFISLTKGMPAKEVEKNVNSSITVAAVLLFIFLFIGLDMFEIFHINLDSFQIAGGIILLILSIFYVIGNPADLAKMHSPDVSVPIGTPLLTGPGVITTTIILVKEYGTLTTFIAAILTLISTWLILFNSAKLYKFLGEHWTNIISRVMGIILAAIAIEFITKGILGIIRPLLC